MPAPSPDPSGQTSLRFFTSGSSMFPLLAHSSNDGCCLGSCALSLFANGLRCLSSPLSLSRRYRITCPLDPGHRSALIGLFIGFLSISGAIQFSVPSRIGHPPPSPSPQASSAPSFTCKARSKSIIFRQNALSTGRLLGLMSQTFCGRYKAHEDTQGLQ